MRREIKIHFCVEWCPVGGWKTICGLTFRRLRKKVTWYYNQTTCKNCMGILNRRAK